MIGFRRVRTNIVKASLHVVTSFWLKLVYGQAGHELPTVMINRIHLMGYVVVYGARMCTCMIIAIRRG